MNTTTATTTTPTPGSVLAPLWDDYLTLNTQAEAITRLLRERGDDFLNDHIALRTYDRAPIGLEAMAAPFEAAGWVARGDYDFAVKKLRAKHYEHATDPSQPKVFISELRTAEFSAEVQAAIDGLVGQLPAGFTDDPAWVHAGRPWQVSAATYERLAVESEYAAWVAAFGFRANHFTVDIATLRSFAGIAELNAFLEANGYALNESGGRIKGSPDVLLEQSSTLADRVEVMFTDRAMTIPACYLEFALRYPLPDGTLYQGFVAASADKIFESTHRAAQGS